MKRFWGKTKHADGCKEWTAYRDRNGYGRFRFNGENRLAHRIAYKLYYGIDPKELFVCHTCDNPSCIEPTHLFLGTQKDNMDDMRHKGREPSRVGQNNGCSRLKDGEVAYIKKMLELGFLQKDIAEDFDVTQQLISRIKNNKAWSHIDEKEFKG